MSVDSACFPISLATALIWNHWFPRKCPFNIHLASVAPISFRKNQGALESVCIKGSGRLWALCTHTWVSACVCAHTLVYSYKSKLQPLSCHVYCLMSEVIQSAAWLMNWLEESTANYPDLSLSRHSAGWSGVCWLNANSPPQSVVGGDCLCVRGVLTLQKLPLPLHGGLGWEMRPAGSSELGS